MYRKKKLRNFMYLLLIKIMAIYYKGVWLDPILWKLYNMVQVIWLYVDLIER